MENTKKSKYLALTIGPIGKTLSNARKTRELWAASYIFSYLMKEIIREIKKNKSYQFIIPNIDGQLKESFKGAFKREDLYKNGVGLFPDRLIVKIPNDEKGGLARMKEKVEETLEELGLEMGKHINAKNRMEVINYVTDYFQVHQLEVDIPEDANPILTIQPYLNSLELQRSYPIKREPFLQKHFERITRSFLVENAWGKPYHSFETILEVAAREFSKDSRFKELQGNREKNYSKNNLTKESQKKLNSAEDEDELTLINHLSATYSDEKKTPFFKTAHKYIAIVQADGDNVGKLIERLGKDLGKLDKFSRELSEFAAEAVGKIAEYGGMPIYAGGDDLLFFAPVVNSQSNLEEEKNIFALLQKLDDLFKARFKQFGGEPNPSLSFGLSISYYKFPLYEALAEAQNLLFGVAKNISGKNVISFKVLKHSGQTFDANLKLTTASKSFKRFEQLLKNAVEKPKEQLSSIMYRIQENEAILKVIGEDATAVKNFFDNSFNEDIHKGSAKDFIKNIAALIPIVYQENDNADNANRQLYSMLRTIAFLTSSNSND